VSPDIRYDRYTPDLLYTTASANGRVSTSRHWSAGKDYIASSLPGRVELPSSSFHFPKAPSTALVVVRTRIAGRRAMLPKFQMLPRAPQYRCVQRRASPAAGSVLAEGRVCTPLTTHDSQPRRGRRSPSDRVARPLCLLLHTIQESARAAEAWLRRRHARQHSGADDGASWTMARAGAARGRPCGCQMGTGGGPEGATPSAR